MVFGGQQARWLTRCTLLRTMIISGMCGFTNGAAACNKQFRVVEVQRTLYDPPPTATLQGWGEAAPPAFEFRKLCLDVSPEMSTGC